MTALAEPRNRRERRAARRTQTAVAEGGARRRIESLTAAAVNVRVVQQFAAQRWGATDWQQEGWLHYRSCPEFRQGINVGANSLSRARLIGVEADPETGELGTQPTTDPDVVEIMGEVFGGPASQGQGLAALKRHLDVAGDCWMFITDSPDRDGTAWEVLSTADVQASGGKITVLQLDGTPRVVDTDRELLIRQWRPDPEHRWQADSPTLALLPVLREIGALSAMVSATVKSRLASAGILWIPAEISLPPTATGTVTSNTQLQADAAAASNAWLDLITEAMTTPIKDPDSAGAVVPMVATVKGDLIEKISHMEFGRDLDAELDNIRQSDIRRLAVGMNAPPEILTGLGDVNHWTGWLITEDFARAYLAPDLELIADTLTRYYLRPALRGRGRDPRAFAVGFDLDALVPKQIKSEDATAAYNAGLLAEVEYMQALGFSVAQIADDRERARRTILGLLRQGSMHMPDLGPNTLAALFPGMDFPPQPTPEEAAGVNGAPAGGPHPRALPAGPSAAGGPPEPTPPPTDGPVGPGP